MEIVYLSDKATNMINISVIIPFYNRAHTLVNCINSVLNQTYKPLEVICVNDHSTDDSCTLVDDICKKNAVIKLIDNDIHKKGAQSARNAGAKIAKGEWVVFLDSDDEWLPDFLEKMSHEIIHKKHNTKDVVYCDCFRLNGELRHSNNIKDSLTTDKVWKLPNVKDLKSLLATSGPMFQGMIINRSFLLETELLDESVISYQEWDTSIRLAKAGAKFHHLSMPLFIYYVGESNTISSDYCKDIIGRYNIIEKYNSDILKLFDERYLTRKYKRILYDFLVLSDKFVWTDNELFLSVVYDVIKKAKVGKHKAYIPPLFRI